MGRACYKLPIIECYVVFRNDCWILFGFGFGPEDLLGWREFRGMMIGLGEGGVQG